MRNQVNMKFKAGSYFLWHEAIFKIVSINNTDNVYVCEPYDYTNFIEDSMFEFFLTDEHEMKHITKKKHPEYFL